MAHDQSADHREMHGRPGQIIMWAEALGVLAEWWREFQRHL